MIRTKSKMFCPVLNKTDIHAPVAMLAPGSAVTITRYNGRSVPALFSCIVGHADGGSTYCVLRRLDLVDDERGTEINNRIAELERLGEDGEA